MLLLALPYQLSLPYADCRQVNLLHLHWIVHSNVMPVRYSFVKDRENTAFRATAFNRISFSNSIH